MAGLLTGKTDYSGVGVYEPKTGFSENFDRQIDLVYSSGQSVSEYNALQEGYDKRIDSVKELTGVELENPYSVGNVFNLKESSEKFETEFSEATSNLDESQRERLEDKDKMWRGIRERHKRLRLGADFSSERASTIGKIGGFLGGMTGLLLDPLQIATLPLGVGSLAGKTVLQAAGRTALTEAAIGGTVEIPIQGLVQPFQKELGVEGAGFKAGAINVGAATLGAGVFGGVVGGGVRALQLKFGKSIDSMTTGELAENLRKIKNPTKEQKELAAALSKEAQAENSNPYIEKPKRVFQGDQDVTPTPKGPDEDPTLEVTPEAFKELEETRKAAQVEVDEARKAVEGIEGKEGDPVIDEPLKPKVKKPASKDLDINEDSLLVAIAKMGGLNKKEAVNELGTDAETLTAFNKSRPFQSATFKDKGGKDLDGMAEALAQEGIEYLPVDDAGHWDLDVLRKMIDDEMSGIQTHHSAKRVTGDDEIEAAFARFASEQVDPELQAARDRLADAEFNLENITRDLDRAKVIEHEKNLAEADKALEEGRQPNIAENSNTEAPVQARGKQARADAEKTRVYDDPHGEGAAFDEQTRAYDEALREAMGDPEKMKETIWIEEADASGNVVPVAKTFETIAEEIEADEKFIKDLTQCLR